MSSESWITILKKRNGWVLIGDSGTKEIDSFDASCGVPVDHYFWLNSLHPTFPMHDVLAEGVAMQLIAGPNVC